ncbi:MAG: hypothetical protein LUE92_11985 [Clostridiales bacterium]|nr:hypothetical protein [Clostridiales bacterium]
MNLKERLQEWISIQVAKKPSRAILLGIILFNIAFLILAACLLSRMVPDSAGVHGFWASAYYALSMILDAGCIQFIVSDVSHTNAAIVVVCIFVIVIGMIAFTGCVIGYVTNAIFSFVAEANAGGRELKISGHTVILNWNSRASEIVNDLVYCENPEKVVILVPEGRVEVEKEIENRLADTMAQENNLLREQSSEMTFWEKRHFQSQNRLSNRMTIIVREGDTFSMKQLMDISLDKAKTVIILNHDEQRSVCRYNSPEHRDERMKGNATTVKTLMLVAEITSAENSANDQKIVVEVEDYDNDKDNWTMTQIERIIAHKEKLGKCNIVPIPVNQILGQLLSQFSIMPELNQVYSELFSNRGAEFYCMPANPEKPEGDREEHLANYHFSVPLAAMESKTGWHYFYMADKENDMYRRISWTDPGLTVRYNPDYWLPRRNVLILGHNTRMGSLMSGFESFRAEWNPAADGRDILNISVIDDPKSLERMDFYKRYPYVNDPIEADLYDQETIYQAVNSFIDDMDGDTGILILSDDSVSVEDQDARALTYLVYIQDILAQRRAANGGKDTERIDVVVEILNPKNYDVVHSYSVNNVVISNRYISKMITQIGDKQPLFEFYSDILTYDDPDSAAYTSKELYIKKVGDYLEEVPSHCSAASLIRAVYRAAIERNPENLDLVLGYVTEDDEMTIFAGDQTQIMLDLKAEDKLILYSNH